MFGALAALPVVGKAHAQPPDPANQCIIVDWDTGVRCPNERADGDRMCPSCPKGGDLLLPANPSGTCFTGGPPELRDGAGFYGEHPKPAPFEHKGIIIDGGARTISVREGCPKRTGAEYAKDLLEAFALFDRRNENKPPHAEAWGAGPAAIFR